MTHSRPPASILFVCMGNICRSPLAEGSTRAALAEAGVKLQLDSAGTHGYHIGNPPDARARAVAREFGYAIDDLRARQVAPEDYIRFDLILAADMANLDWLQQRRPDNASAELALLLPWCGEQPGLQLADPYYGEMDDFRVTARQLQAIMPGLLDRVAGRA